MAIAMSASSIEKELSARAIRALAKSALRGNETAIEILRNSKKELEKWSWIPEVKELLDKGII